MWLLSELGKEIKEKRPHLVKKKDSTRMYTCAVAISKLYESKFELLPHPPHLTDLALRSFKCFQTWKNGLPERDLS